MPIHSTFLEWIAGMNELGTCLRRFNEVGGR